MESCQNTDVHALLLEVQDYHFRKIQAMKSVKRCYLTLIKTRRDGGHGTLQEAVWKDKVTSASTLVSVSNDNNFTITKEENSKIEEEDKSNHLPHTLYWVQSLPSSSLRHAHAAFTLGKHFTIYIVKKKVLNLK